MRALVQRSSSSMMLGGGDHKVHRSPSSMINSHGPPPIDTTAPHTEFAEGGPPLGSLLGVASAPLSLLSAGAVVAPAMPDSGVPARALPWPIRRARDLSRGQDNGHARARNLSRGMMSTHSSCGNAFEVLVSAARLAGGAAELPPMGAVEATVFTGPWSVPNSRQASFSNLGGAGGYKAHHHPLGHSPYIHQQEEEVCGGDGGREGKEGGLEPSPDLGELVVTNGEHKGSHSPRWP